jgi:hypothetical protein
MLERLTVDLRSLAQSIFSACDSLTHSAAEHDGTEGLTDERCPTPKGFDPKGLATPKAGIPRRGCIAVLDVG